jgi:hypothetical protein
MYVLCGLYVQTSTGSCCLDPLGCSLVPCFVDTSRCSSCFYGVDMSRPTHASVVQTRLYAAQTRVLLTRPYLQLMLLWCRHVQTNRGFCCPDTSRCSSGPCFLDTSRCSLGLCRVDKSRSSTGSCCLCSSGPFRGISSWAP